MRVYLRLHHNPTVTSIQSKGGCRVVKFVAHLQYGHAQVIVDSFRENVTLVHCMVIVCNHILPFFLSLRVCLIAGIWFHSVVQVDNKDKAYKVQIHGLMDRFTSLHELFHSQWWPLHLMISLSCENEVLHRRVVVCLLQEQMGAW